jgi:hypothetical protein
MSQTKPQTISVWFFIGAVLTIYGVLILATGLYELQSPPPVVLAELHTPIWWGILLLLVGLIYVYLFNPKRNP